MAKRSNTDIAGRKADDSNYSHVKVWFEHDEARMVRGVAAMKGVSPGDWIHQVVVQEIQRALSEEMTKLLEPKAAKKK